MCATTTAMRRNGGLEGRTVGREDPALNGDLGPAELNVGGRHQRQENSASEGRSTRGEPPGTGARNAGAGAGTKPAECVWI
jgi:hypothetical protein